MGDREQGPGRIPDHPSFTYHNLSIEHRPYDQATLSTDVDPGPYLSERYLEVTQDGTKEIRSALELVAKAAESELAAPALLTDWKALNNGRTPTWPGFNKTPPAVMRLFLSSLTDQYGVIEGYISEALSLNPGPLTTTLRNGQLEERPRE